MQQLGDLWTNECCACEHMAALIHKDSCLALVVVGVLHGAVSFPYTACFAPSTLNAFPKASGGLSMALLGKHDQ